MDIFMRVSLECILDWALDNFNLSLLIWFPYCQLSLCT